MVAQHPHGQHVVELHFSTLHRCDHAAVSVASGVNNIEEVLRANVGPVTPALDGSPPCLNIVVMRVAPVLMYTTCLRTKVHGLSVVLVFRVTVQPGRSSFLIIFMIFWFPQGQGRCTRHRVRRRGTRSRQRNVPGPLIWCRRYRTSRGARASSLRALQLQHGFHFSWR